VYFRLVFVELAPRSLWEMALQPRSLFRWARPGLSLLAVKKTYVQRTSHWFANPRVHQTKAKAGWQQDRTK
jgi:hypothetical protein